MLRTMSSSDHLAVQARDPLSQSAFPAGGTRPFAHPGMAQAPRVSSVSTQKRTREFNVTLPAGVRIGPALRALLDDWHAGAGCGRIVDGTCTRIQYHLIEPSKADPRPYVYGAPVVCDGTNTMIGAAITIGNGGDGKRILHCHGGFIDADGASHGGHFNLDETLVGGDGLRLRLSLFEGVALTVSHDSETAYDLLQPVYQS